MIRLLPIFLLLARSTQANWLTCLNGRGVEYRDAAISPSGDFFVVTNVATPSVFISSQKNISLLNYPPSNTTTTVLYKFDFFGVLQWSVRMTGIDNSTSEGVSVSVDKDGGVYVGGRTGSKRYNFLSIDGSARHSLLLEEDGCFQVKYNSSGYSQWSVFQTLGCSILNQKTIDQSKNMIVLSYGGTTSARYQDAQNKSTTVSIPRAAFRLSSIAKYDTGGNFLWAILIGGSTGRIFATRAISDSSGAIYVVGDEASGNVTFYHPNGNETTPNFMANETFQNSAFLFKLSPSGSPIWTIGMLSTNNLYMVKLSGVSLHELSNSVYITGYNRNEEMPVVDVNGTHNFTFDANMSLSLSDAYSFVAKYTTNGRLVWITKIFSRTAALTTDIVTTSSGQVYVAGYAVNGWVACEGTDGRLLNISSPKPDSTFSFLAKYSPDGRILLASTWDGSFRTGHLNYPVLNRYLNLMLDRNDMMYVGGASPNVNNFIYNQNGVLSTTLSNNEDLMCRCYLLKIPVLITTSTLGPNVTTITSSSPLKTENKPSLQVLEGASTLKTNTVEPIKNATDDDFFVSDTVVVAITLCSTIPFLGIIMYMIHRRRKREKDRHFNQFGMRALTGDSEASSTYLTMPTVLVSTSFSMATLVPSVEPLALPGYLSLDPSKILPQECWAGGSNLFEAALFSSEGRARVIIKKFKSDINQLEVSILARLMNYDNIVKIVGFTKTPPMLVLEYYDNNLEHHILNPKSFPFATNVSILCDIISGIVYLHKLGIYHRNLKPSNIFVSFANPVIRAFIGGFDYSIPWKAELGGVQASVSYSENSLSYSFTAPEILIMWQRSNLSALPLATFEKSDMFAFAVIAYEVIEQTRVWNGLSVLEITNCVIEGQRPLFSQPATQSYSSIIPLVTSCWNSNPRFRPTAAVARDSLLQILMQKPNSRQ